MVFVPPLAMWRHRETTLFASHNFMNSDNPSNATWTTYELLNVVSLVCKRLKCSQTVEVFSHITCCSCNCTYGNNMYIIHTSDVCSCILPYMCTHVKNCIYGHTYGNKMYDIHKSYIFPSIIHFICTRYKTLCMLIRMN